MRTGDERSADIIGRDPRPRFFGLERLPEPGFEPPAAGSGVAVRTWVRSLSGMQKEAVVLDVASSTAWRLVSDEGPYLSGHDAAPCPLAFMATGMVASYFEDVSAALRADGRNDAGLQLTLDNHYTMEGSALRGTMTGGAQSPSLLVEVGSGDGVKRVRALVEAAVAAAPIAGLMAGVHASRFSLSLNGRPVDAGTAAGAPPTRLPAFDELSPARSSTALVTRLTPAEEIEGVPGGVASSLAEHQQRRLHVRGRCRRRDDGAKVVVQNLYAPIGSEFELVSDEPPVRGGGGLAPDALSYMSAGIGFCFMTQVGRYASIVKRPFERYAIEQDTWFLPQGRAVETRVMLEGEADEDYAREVLRMSEQTCFLHALCRTPLRPEVRLA